MWEIFQAVQSYERNRTKEPRLKLKATMAKLWRFHQFFFVSGKSLCSSLLFPFRQMGSTCWDWKEESRILHFSCHLWKIWTCPTNAFLCLSLSKSLSCAKCCPRRRLRRQRQKVPRRTGHSPYRWTVKYVKTIQSFISSGRQERKKERRVG